MGSITRHFRSAGNRILVMERFVGDDEGEGALIGHSWVYVDAENSYFNLSYDQLRDAGSGEILVAEDGKTGSIRAAYD